MALPYLRRMDAFSALADGNRRRILEMLAKEGELSAGDISEKFNISAPAISQHLKVLRESQLVVMQKRAQHRLYSINPKALQNISGWAQAMLHVVNAQRYDSAMKELLTSKKK